RGQVDQGNRPRDGGQRGQRQDPPAPSSAHGRDGSAAMKRRRRKGTEAVEAVLVDEAIPQGTLDDPDDVDALRAAIELRASRVGDDLPSSEAVETIKRRVLADDIEEKTPATISRRALLVAGGVAAAGVA